MIPSVQELSQFSEEFKQLKKKHHHIDDDLQDFYNKCLCNPKTCGDPVIQFERKLWKARMKSTDMQRGKSGGFRLIYYFDESKPDVVYMLSIYAKSVKQDITYPQLIAMLNRVKNLIFKKEETRPAE